MGSSFCKKKSNTLVCSLIHFPNFDLWILSFFFAWSKCCCQCVVLSLPSFCFLLFWWLFLINLILEIDCSDGLHLSTYFFLHITSLRVSYIVNESHAVLKKVGLLIKQDRLSLYSCFACLTKKTCASFVIHLTLYKLCAFDATDVLHRFSY